MKNIILSNSKYVAVVDDEDFEELSKYKWRIQEISTQKYVLRSARVGELGKGKRGDIRIHNQIMRPPDGLEVDHIDRDGLNNQKSNLRLCTHQQNMFNRVTNPKRSRYKGVAWHKGNRMWQANIGFCGRQISLGYSKDEQEAALMYDAAARKYFGEFAVLNFP